jgi:hypothetical protein
MKFGEDLRTEEDSWGGDKILGGGENPLKEAKQQLTDVWMTHDLSQDVDLLARRFKHRMRVICVSSTDIDDLRRIFLARFFVDAPADDGRDSPGRQATVKPPKHRPIQTSMPSPHKSNLHAN